jgi:UDP-N-acetylglucosamine enolpyruvyl transferase
MGLFSYKPKSDARLVFPDQGFVTESGSSPSEAWLKLVDLVARLWPGYVFDLTQLQVTAVSETSSVGDNIFTSTVFHVSGFIRAK